MTLFLAEKEIAMVNEVDIWIKVSQEEFEMLTVGSKIGQYILQLPGKKSASKCEDLPINERTESDCYFENYKPGKITTDDIKKMIKEGKMNTQINKTYEESKNNEENDSKKEVNDQGNPKDVIEKQQSVDDDKKNSDTGKEKPGTNEQELSPKEQKEERKKKDALIQDFFKD